jgi:uncharacterized phage protein (TIGR01671 family)
MSVSRFNLRAWDDIAQTMRYGVEIVRGVAVYYGNCDGTYLIENVQIKVGAKSGKPPLMQSTGLVDSTGQEIFEGDLVVMQNPDDDELNRPEEVRYIKRLGGFALCRKDFVIDGEVFQPQCAECVQVIGSIYENMELVKLRHSPSLDTRGGK